MPKRNRDPEEEAVQSLTAKKRLEAAKILSASPNRRPITSAGGR